MVDLLLRAFAWLMNRVRVNKVRPSIDKGVPVFLKRRRRCGSFTIWFGNQFLKLAHSGICMFVRPAEWLDWELHCAQLLYPDRIGARIGSDGSLIVREVPGNSLRQLVDRRESVDAAFLAAARELRRVHQLPCNRYKACWSHGDLHVDNILYDADADRAFLIDFDTRHEFSRNQVQRHSDDLRVILIELIAILDEGWSQPAIAFLEEYGEPAVLEELRRQLYVPNGFGKLFWFTRTHCRSLRQIQPRLQRLREIVGQVAFSTGSVNSTPPYHDVSTENNR